MDFWTADRIETLRMMTAGNSTASEIALALGPSCNRNMVIGKWRRLGISHANPTLWSEDEIATLKRLHTESVPYPRIAAIIGRTEAACMNKAASIGLPSRGHNTVRRPKKGVRTAAGAFTPKIVEGLPKPSAEVAVGILDVTGCRWPVSPDDAPKDAHRFCNHPTDGHPSYCPYHQQVAYSKPIPKAEVKRFKMPTAVLRMVG